MPHQIITKTRSVSLPDHGSLRYNKKISGGLRGAGMKFLYVGQTTNRAAELEQALSRANMKLERTTSPEHAFFKVLHEDIAAVFLDLTDDQVNGEEALASLASIDKGAEVVLIAEAERLDRFNKESLRGCCGFLLPDIGRSINSMVLHQLTDKITLKMRLESLKNSAIIDGLTQLYNHAYFQQRLEEEINLLKPAGHLVTLVMLDIDNFKNYNDTNGHPAGDRLLKKLAALLSRSVRKFDLAARYGGEEFALVFPGASLNTALAVTERIRKRIVAADFEFGSSQPLGFVSASFGLAMLDHKTLTSKKALIVAADQALYKAKTNGKNCIWRHQDGIFSPFE